VLTVMKTNCEILSYPLARFPVLPQIPQHRHMPENRGISEF